MRAGFLISAVAVALLVLSGGSTVSAEQVCQQADSSTDEVLSGVTLTRDSSFLCADAPDSDTYEFTVEVSNSADSVEGVVIDEFELSHTTPRPRGQAPNATGQTQDLPIVLMPGESASFTVEGTYELVETDEGKKANLHFRASGEGLMSGDPFHLGINAMFRAPDAVESDQNGGPLWRR